jgi:hypothetical protein
MRTEEQAETPARQTTAKMAPAERSVMLALTECLVLICMASKFSKFRTRAYHQILGFF